jgi:hypothetical protein
MTSNRVLISAQWQPQAKTAKGFFLVPKKEMAPHKSIEFETGSSVLKVLDKSSNYEAFSSEMHKYLEQLWSVSD